MQQLAIHINNRDEVIDSIGSETIGATPTELVEGDAEQWEFRNDEDDVDTLVRKVEDNTYSTTAPMPTVTVGNDTVPCAIFVGYTPRRRPW